MASISLRSQFFFESPKCSQLKSAEWEKRADVEVGGGVEEGLKKLLELGGKNQCYVTD